MRKVYLRLERLGASIKIREFIRIRMRSGVCRLHQNVRIDQVYQQQTGRLVVASADLEEVTMPVDMRRVTRDRGAASGTVLCINIEFCTRTFVAQGSLLCVTNLRVEIFCSSLLTYDKELASIHLP
jgi:hypothetical protein